MYLGMVSLAKRASIDSESNVLVGYSVVLDTKLPGMPPCRECEKGEVGHTDRERQNQEKYHAMDGLLAVHMDHKIDT